MPEKEISIKVRFTGIEYLMSDREQGMNMGKIPTYGEILKSCCGKYCKLPQKREFTFVTILNSYNYLHP